MTGTIEALRAGRRGRQLRRRRVGARRLRRDVHEGEPDAARRDGRRVLVVERGRRRGGRSRCGSCVRRLGGAADGAPRRVSHRSSGGARGARRADRDRHEHRDGQAAARGARRGRARRADPALRRERGLPLRRRALRAGGDRRAGVDAAQARRRHRAHHAVELPDRDPDLEARARADLRQHRRPEARVRGAAHGPAHRRGVRGGGAAARRAQRPHRPRLDRRRGARAGHARARDLVHRLRRDRPLRARRRDAARQARPARARRAQPAARARRRRHRPRGRGDVCRRVLVRRPEVHGDATHLRAGRGLRRLQDASCSRASSAARSATRSIPTSRSARS